MKALALLLTCFLHLPVLRFDELRLYTAHKKNLGHWLIFHPLYGVIPPLLAQVESHFKPGIHLHNFFRDQLIHHPLDDRSDVAARDRIQNMLILVK